MKSPTNLKVRGFFRIYTDMFNFLNICFVKLLFFRFEDLIMSSIFNFFSYTYLTNLKLTCIKVLPDSRNSNYQNHIPNYQRT